MLRTRFIFGMLPLLALLAGLGAYGILIAHQLGETVRVDMARLYTVQQAVAPLRTILWDAQEIAQLRGPVYAPEQRAAFAEQRRLFEALLRATMRDTSHGSLREKLEAVDEAWFDYLASVEPVLNSTVGAPSGAALGGSMVAVGARLEAVADQVAAELQLIDGQTAQLVRRSTWALALTLAAAVGLALVIAWQLARGLLGPIQRLSRAVAAVGEGDLARELPVTERDELGQLAQTFNRMREKLRAYHEAMNEEVRRAQRTTSATLSASPDPMFVFGSERRIELRNPAAYALGDPGLLPEELHARVRRVIETGEHDLPTGFDHAITVTVGREPRHFLPRVLAVADQMTGLAGAALLLQDVTKLRLLDDAKGNLVGTVSHELKTPLTSLRMAVYLLLEENVGPLGPKQRELLEMARDESDRLMRILDDLLDLTRLERGAAALRLAPVELEVLLAQMAAEIRPQAAAQRQRVVITVTTAGTELPLPGEPAPDPRGAATRAVTPDEPAAAPLVASGGEADLGGAGSRVWVDRDRIRHVFMNLLTNAVKYGPPDSTITLYAAPADAGFVRLGVRDEGAGLPPEEAARVFDRFYRVAGQSQSGAGLGLAIAREIVVAHGGSIRCASEPGRGCDFHFFLPTGAPAVDAWDTAHPFPGT